MGFAELNVSMQMRDTITKLVQTTVDRLRPEYRYATVVSTDSSTWKATITFIGETNPVIVNIGSVWPAVGARVRVEGSGTDKYIADVVGGKIGYPSIESGQHLDNYTKPGKYYVETAPGGVIQWPGRGIPSVQAADANNAAGSYLTPLTGLLEVSVTPAGRVVQVATLNNPAWGTDGLAAVTLKRLRSADGVTWGAWKSDRFTYSATSTAIQQQIAQYGVASRSNILRAERIDFRPPFGIECMDDQGIVWWNPVDRTFQTSPGWRDTGLFSPWVAYSTSPNPAPPGPPNYYNSNAVRTEAGIIVLRGLVRSGTVGSVMFTLPQGMRPSGQLSFLCPDTNGTGGSYIRVATNGNVYWDGSISGSNGWVSLDGVKFPAADVAPNSAWIPLVLGTAWENYNVVDISWPGAAYWVDKYGRVWYRGLVRTKVAGNPGGNSVMCTQPSGLAPNAQTHHAVLASGSGLYASVHILGTDIVWKPESPTNSTQWVSLCNLTTFPVATFPESSWVTMVITGGANYGGGFPGASLIRMPDGIIHCRGLVSGAFTSATMGLGDRHSGGQMIWATSSNSSLSRMNMSNGFGLGKQTGNTTWTTLDGIAYLVEG